ncbi:hypothetical protein BDF20DRAFT_550255 [Mycotypha africana]|uniref:uncharacterized protein n=1 Tax=Mycotypha africana TaxID=64632 RepID=UPI0023000A94|nr:uncharacterized protein BDF20DRAFT_550255 [Mycotypha africana]KAI8977183.1 hypothetical protein BDF20DRAFT_550255 [Mycotypha africana]
MVLVSALYGLVRSLLETPERKFVLCLPPRAKLVEPNITLYKAGLAPASNVLFGWIEKGSKGDNALRKEYLDMKEELTHVSSSQSLASSISSPKISSSSNSSTSQTKTSKPIPKWLQKGLFNKK